MNLSGDLDEIIDYTCANLAIGRSPLEFAGAQMRLFPPRAEYDRHCGAGTLPARLRRRPNQGLTVQKIPQKYILRGL